MCRVKGLSLFSMFLYYRNKLLSEFSCTGVSVTWCITNFNETFYECWFKEQMICRFEFHEYVHAAANCLQHFKRKKIVVFYLKAELENRKQIQKEKESSHWVVSIMSWVHILQKKNVFKGQIHLQLFFFVFFLCLLWSTFSQIQSRGQT